MLAGLIQSVECLNKTKKLTLRQIRENVSCQTAFWDNSVFPPLDLNWSISSSCISSLLSFKTELHHLSSWLSKLWTQTGTAPTYIKLETQEPWWCSSSLSIKAWKIGELRLRKSQCFSPSPKARIWISLFSSVQSFSHIQLFVTPWTVACQASLSITNSRSLLKLLDLLAVQGNLKSCLQHHSSKASILQHSAFFIAQISHRYITTEKNIALNRWTFVGKLMSLLFNMLSRLVITFLPRSKLFFFFFFNFMAAVAISSNFGAQKNFPLFSHLFPMKWWDWMP